MAQAAFDTLSAAQRLQEEFEFTPKQAEGTAKLVHEQLVGNVATKDDVKALKGDIEKLDEKIDTSVKALDEKIDASVKALDKKIETVSVGLIDMKADLRWIKLIGGLS